MFGRWRLVLVLGGTLLLSTWARSQDASESAPRMHGALPPMWSKLGLTDEQKQQVYAAQSQYRAKIDELRHQVRKLEHEQRAALEKVLTPAQKDRLRELVNQRAPGGSAKDNKDASKEAEKSPATPAPDGKQPRP